MALEVTGKITKILDLQTGTTQSGSEWKKQSFILETTETYNNVYCFELFGEEKVENFLKFNKVGNEVKVDFNVNTNEWKGKYFTTLSAWKVFKATNEMQEAVNKIDTAFETVTDIKEGDNSDLPF